MFPSIFMILTGCPAVKSIVGDRIYGHDEAPQNTTRPYITWFLVSGIPENSLSCRPDIDRCTVQIDCWHQTGAGVWALAEAVRRAVERENIVTNILFDQREPETKLYRIALEVDSWTNR